MRKKNLTIIRPILAIIAVIICLAMVRLGIWQLDRAEQKKVILTQSIDRSKQTAVPVQSLLILDSNFNTFRFRRVTASGSYLSKQSILVDNQVYEQNVGYALMTPFKLSGSGDVILVDRGWLSVGLSRDVLPNFDTPEGKVLIEGRLNLPYAKPPIWNDKYDVSDGMVWQHLPITEFNTQTGLSAVPLVLELAPNNAKHPSNNAEASNNAEGSNSAAVVNWQPINDEWVFKHQAYAFQWFSMALVFAIACLILLVKSIRNTKELHLDE